MVVFPWDARSDEVWIGLIPLFRLWHFFPHSPMVMVLVPKGKRKAACSECLISRHLLLSSIVRSEPSLPISTSLTSELMGGMLLSDWWASGANCYGLSSFERSHFTYVMQFVAGFSDYRFFTVALISRTISLVPI